jgi:Ca2+-binding EF-hand superfamily protein
MTGFIGVGQLKYILTNLGEKMTDEEVDELLKAVDTSSGQVNYTGKSPVSRTCAISAFAMHAQNCD